jgi:hypothetical protein
MAQVGGSGIGTTGIEPSVVVVSEIVDSAVGGSGFEYATSYSSVIEYSATASMTEVTDLEPIEVNVSVASCVQVP